MTGASNLERISFLSKERSPSFFESHTLRNIEGKSVIKNLNGDIQICLPLEEEWNKEGNILEGCIFEQVNEGENDLDDGADSMAGSDNGFDGGNGALMDHLPYSQPTGNNASSPLEAENDTNRAMHKKDSSSLIYTRHGSGDRAMASSSRGEHHGTGRCQPMQWYNNVISSFNSLEINGGTMVVNHKEVVQIDKTLCEREALDLVPGRQGKGKHLANTEQTLRKSGHIASSKNSSERPKNCPFRFQRFWTEHEGFLNAVKTSWENDISGSPMLVMAQKLKRLKVFLHSWVKGNFSNFNLEMMEAKKCMDEIQTEIDRDGISDSIYAKEADAKTRYLKAMQNYEKLWAEKSRSRWRDQGDRCSKNFHISVKMRRMKNSIKSLKMNEGTLIFDKAQIKEYVTRYYVHFHKGVPLTSHMDLLQCIPNVLEEWDRGRLDGIPFDTEIKGAVWDLDPDSALGPNGFPGAFYKSCWDIISSDILASARISVLLNGGPVGYFGVEKGLRQRDPISPMLFIIAKEVLCRGLSELLANNNIKALSGPRGAIISTHILFADDVFIFSNASIRKQAIAEELGISICNFPTRYLGVKIFKGRVKKESLIPILDKVKGQLAGWKGKILSIAARVELVRSVILGMMNHSSAVYWWPSSLIATMERLMKNFIWTGEIDTVKKISVRWDLCCRPKDEGGLELRRLRDINKAMLCNMVWRVKHEKSLACKFFRARFLRGDGSFKKSYKPSSIWPGFRKMWEFVASKEAWTIGNGKSINFWSDKWLGGKSILELVGLEGESSLHCKGKVSDFIDNFKWKSPNVISPLLHDIFEKIQTIKIPSYTCEDMCLWSLSSDGIFNSNSAWEDIRIRNLKVPWFSLIWGKKVQPRVSIFGWRMVHDKLPTDDAVQKRGIALVSKCSLCGMEAETVY
ncbi:uncharacterized protein LOC122086899 [Macadamia integrifolia]|uniref:uncharacterized protein LOC122086899 n=1 Tax=Macadamia integrifolia TaxID=60698 RepID=UPI001C4F1F08|nr:uncharacterized protein LOC122086899 [Macadamia integrifolia]